MDVSLICFPVDDVQVSGSLGLSVEVIKNAAQLRVLFLGLVRVGSGSKSVQPLDGQVVV